MSLPLFDEIIKDDQRGNPDLVAASRFFRTQHAKAMEKIAKSVGTSKIYEISDDALEVACGLLRFDPTEFLPLVETIALPADRVYIEFDWQSFERIEMAAGATIDSDTTLRRGILAIGAKDDQDAPIAFHFINLTKHNFPMLANTWAAFRGTTQTNWPVKTQREFANALGLTGNKINRVARYDALDSNYVAWEDDPIQGASAKSLGDICLSHIENYSKSVNDIQLGLSQGKLQTALALLSIINRPTLLTSTRRNIAINNGVRTKQTANAGVIVDTVSLKVSPKRTLTKMRQAIKSRKLTIQHEVAEHWAYRSRRTINPNCNHYWVATGVNTQQNCSGCGALRWKRSGSLRGHASAGTKITSHIVVR